MKAKTSTPPLFYNSNTRCHFDDIEFQETAKHN